MKGIDLTHSATGSLSPAARNPLTADTAGVISPEFIRRRSAHLHLKDGTRILLRPIVPEDRQRIAEAFRHLSRESIERRFMTSVERLSSEMLSYLTELDYVRHFAWGALALDSPGQPGIGVTRYISSGRDPEVAEAAITVIDEFQRRGLGAILLHALAASGQLNGIVKFRSYVSTENLPMVSILKALGSVTSVDSPGVLVSDLELASLLARLDGSSLRDQIIAAARAEAGVIASDKPNAL